jgi:hypothetical protein
MKSTKKFYSLFIQSSKMVEKKSEQLATSTSDPRPAKLNVAFTSGVPDDEDIFADTDQGDPDLDAIGLNTEEVGNVYKSLQSDF